MYSNNDGIWSDVIKIIILLVLTLFLISISQSCSRQENNMVNICEGYSYDADTYIIYREMESGRYGTRLVYTPYYDKNGNLCRYDTKTFQWVPIKE
mgnify:CR=1 FL=1